MARARRQAREYGPYAVLYPAITEATHRTGAAAVGLIDVGGSAGLNLIVDRVGIAYSNGLLLGDPDSQVQVSASVVRGRPLPTTAMPEVMSRIELGPDPLDVDDPADAAWLRACVGTTPELTTTLEAQTHATAAVHPLLLRGDPVKLIAEAVARVPAGALPVVTTTWSVSRLSAERRLRLVQALTDAASDRTVAWVSIEGVGVAPTIPTLGDRPASGHTLIGLALFDPSGTTSETLGRCWSRGRILSWLAGP